MGHSKMAVNKIPLFAKALDIDECFFLDLVLGEYEPELYELIKRNFKGVNKLEKNIKEKDIDNKDNPSLSLECALDISRLDWNDAKLIIDNLDEEELIDFEKHASKLNLKKIAWHNIRISMSTYAKIKNKAIKLNMNPTKLFNHMLNSI